MTDRPLPRTGIRVLELAQIVAGPFCGALMADFGAEVIKTELPGKGDDLRRLGPTENGTNYWYAVDNRGKKVITLDLHTAKGQEIVRRLVPLCDVVIENFRPEVLDHHVAERHQPAHDLLALGGVQIERDDLLASVVHGVPVVGAVLGGAEAPEVVAL